MRGGTTGRSWAVIAIAIATVLVQEIVAEDIPVLCPQPRETRLRAGDPALDLAGGSALRMAAGSAKPVVLAAERLQAAVKRVTDRQGATATLPTIVIGNLEDYRTGDLQNAVVPELLAAADALPAEGYVLRVSASGTTVVGKDVRGTVYGVETLIQLVGRGPRIPALDVRDDPDTAWRLTYCAGGDHLDARIRQIVGLCVAYKLNLIVFENPDFYRLDDPDVKARLLEVFTYCKDMGIEPVPELQSFGWSQCILPLEPLCVEAAPVRDRPFRFGDDDLAQPCARPLAEVAVLNAGLDRADGQQFADWQQDDVGVTIFAADSERGGKCVQIRRTTPGMSRLSQHVRCAANTTYELAVDMKTEAGTDFAAYFEVYGVPRLAHGGEFAAYTHITTTTGWERRSLQFRSGPATELVIYLRVQDGIGTAWFDNVTLRTVADPPLRHVVETPEQPLVVTSPDHTTTYKAGADYDVVPGELRYPFTDAAKPWQIVRRKDGQIKPGQEVLVSCEAAETDDITYCPSEPRTQALMQRAIAETVATFRPRLLHLGHDEPRVINRDTRCRRRGLQAHQLYVDDLRRLCGYVRQADPACRPMIWADPFRVNDKDEVQVAWFSDEKCSLATALRDVPRDVILCPWRYSETDAALLHRDLASLAAAGFEVTASPWYDLANTAAWGRTLLRFRQESPRCLGLFLTTWDDRWDALPFASDLMWGVTRPDLTGGTAMSAAAWRQRYAGFETYRPR
jgi:hypothetical protein